MAQLWSMPEAQIMVFNPPPIPGLGTSSGFEFQLQDSDGTVMVNARSTNNGV